MTLWWDGTRSVTRRDSGKEPKRGRCANLSLTMDRYVQAVTPAKREAQGRILASIPFPNVPTRLTDVAVSV